MDIQISISMPAVLAGTYLPDWAKDDASNKAYLAQMQASNPREYTSFGKHTLYVVKLTNGNFQYYVTDLTDDPLIQYSVLVEEIRTRGLKAFSTLSQVSLWRNIDYLGLPQFAPHVFWSVLFPKYKNILSDSVQSKDGKRFWLSRMSEALENGYYVYALQMDNKHFVSKIFPILSVDDSSIYYSDEPDSTGKKYRLFIVNKTLA
jgi:hypothetical protein